MRTFGQSTRNDDIGKLDFEGFLSPLVLERYAQYMHKHRFLEDGTMRAGDNWQLSGFPYEVLMKSMYRHFFDVWKEHREIETKEGIEDALCALMFNANCYLHQLIKDRRALGKKTIDGHGGVVK